MNIYTMIDSYKSLSFEKLLTIEDDNLKNLKLEKFDSRIHTWKWAAVNGYLQVIEFLHKNRIEGCTKDVMNMAAINGHLDVIQWLHENRSEGCTKEAMNMAAGNGHLEVVRFLKLHYNF
jgi:hypothetical protein